MINTQAMMTDLQDMLAGVQIPYAPVQQDWALWLRYGIAQSNDLVPFATDVSQGDTTGGLDALLLAERTEGDRAAVYALRVKGYLAAIGHKQQPQL